MITDYFLRISVIQPAIVNGEEDGIALLTWFNPHGVFIALEELGYLVMSLSFLSLAPVFSKTDRIERTIRLIFIISFLINIISFIAISIQYGVHREYYFEVIVISIGWIVLITSGILLAKKFIREAK